MKKIFGKKYLYDIALDEGMGAHLIIWVTGLMVFFVTLALSVNFALATLSSEWMTGLSGSLTVELRPPVAEKLSAEQAVAFEKNAQKILWLAKRHPAVSDARLLSEDEIRRLIEPWLGEKLASDMPLPAVIDLRLVRDADTFRLQSDILALVPDATIDSHADTLDDVKTLVNTARLFVLLLTGVIVMLAVVAVSGIVRAKFSIHRPEVETLHLLGASDEYIARQFRQHTLRGTLRGAFVGLGAMLLAIAAIGLVTDTIDKAILPHVSLQPLEWALLILSPVAAGTLVAHFTAQTTAMKELARLP